MLSTVFRDESGKVNTEDNNHHCQVQLAIILILLFYRPPGSFLWLR